MTKIHKKIKQSRQSERRNASEAGRKVGVAGATHSHSSEAEQKAGVETTIRSHDFRFRDEKTLEGLGLDSKSQKRMVRVKKLVSKK